MPWDQSRPVPWKRLLMFEAIYVGLFAAFVVVFQKNNVAGALSSIGFAVVLTTVVLYALLKFGYYPNWLRSRGELAEIRREKQAAREVVKARKAGKPAPTEERYRPAATRRTSTGPTNRPRRTRDTRKR